MWTCPYEPEPISSPCLHFKTLLWLLDTLEGDIPNPPEDEGVVPTVPSGETKVNAAGQAGDSRAVEGVAAAVVSEHGVQATGDSAAMPSTLDFFENLEDGRRGIRSAMLALDRRSGVAPASNDGKLWLAFNLYGVHLPDLAEPSSSSSLTVMACAFRDSARLGRTSFSEKGSLCASRPGPFLLLCPTG